MDLLESTSLYCDLQFNSAGSASCINSFGEISENRNMSMYKYTRPTKDMEKSGGLIECSLSQPATESSCETIVDSALMEKGTPENLLEKSEWNGNLKELPTDNHATKTPGNCTFANNFAPENTKFFKDTQGATSDKNCLSNGVDVSKSEEELVNRKKGTNFQEIDFAVDETVVKVVDDDVIIAWTEVKQIKSSDGCQFYCSICNESFRSRTNVVVHLRLHDISKPYHCVWCGESSQTEFDAKVHYRSHTGVHFYTCAVCGRRFSKEKMLERHRSDCGIQFSSSRWSPQSSTKQTARAHEGDETDISETLNHKIDMDVNHFNECPESFATVDELTSRHKQTNHCDQRADWDIENTAKTERNSSVIENTSEEDPPNIDKTSERLATKQEEKSKNKNKVQKNFVCSTCGKAFRASKPLKEHEVVHTGAREFPCEICGKAFGTRANMRLHLSRHSDEKPFACNVCNATFRQKDSLKVHLRKHNGERPFVCHVCQMTFDRNFTLKNHLLTHGEVRSFVCVVCGKAFTTRGGLNNHERLHSKDPSEKRERKPPSKPGTGNWICDECGKMYSTRSNLKMHQRSHEAAAVTYPCCVCGRDYKHKDSLEVHMRRHRDQRPYSCPTCGRNFYRNWTLKLHMLTHTGEKPHKCPVSGCDRSFTQSSSLYYHVQSHGKKVERASKKSIKDGGPRSTHGDSNPTVNIPDNTVRTTDVRRSDSVVPNIETADSLRNDHPLENTSLFITNPQGSNPSEITDPVSVRDVADISGSTIENDSLSIGSIINGTSSSLDRETLSVKVAVEGIHSSVLNGMVLNGLDAIVPSNAHVALANALLNRSSLSQTETLSQTGALIDTVVQPLGDVSASVGSLVQTDVSPSSVWGNSALPFTISNISDHPAGISLEHTDPPPLRPLSQTMDQSLYVLSSGTDSVPLLVSVDGHLYQPDVHDKASGVHNVFVQQLY